MGDEAKYTTDPASTAYLLRMQEMKNEVGVLGGFFGSTQRAASSIAWVTIFLLVLAGVASLFFSTLITPTDYWKTVSPIITLAFGYLFGSNK